MLWPASAYAFNRINVSFTEQGLTFGGETPLTPLATAALALNPITAPLVPVQWTGDAIDDGQITSIHWEMISQPTGSVGNGVNLTWRRM